MISIALHPPCAICVQAALLPTLVCLVALLSVSVKSDAARSMCGFVPVACDVEREVCVRCAAFCMTYANGMCPPLVLRRLLPLLCRGLLLVEGDARRGVEVMDCVMMEEDDAGPTGRGVGRGRPRDGTYSGYLQSGNTRFPCGVHAVLYAAAPWQNPRVSRV